MFHTSQSNINKAYCHIEPRNYCNFNPLAYAYIYFTTVIGAPQQQLTAIFAYLNSLSQTKLALSA